MKMAVLNMDMSKLAKEKGMRRAAKKFTNAAVVPKDRM